MTAVKVFSRIAAVVNRYAAGKLAFVAAVGYFAVVLVVAADVVIELLFLRPYSPPTDRLEFVTFPGSWLAIVLLLLPDLWGWTVVGSTWYPWVLEVTLLFVGALQAWLLWRVCRGRVTNSAHFRAVSHPLLWRGKYRSTLIVGTVLVLGLGIPFAWWNLTSLNFDNRGRQKVEAFLYAYKRRDFQKVVSLMCSGASIKDMSSSNLKRPQLMSYTIISSSAEQALFLGLRFEAQVRVSFSDGQTKNEIFVGQEGNDSNGRTPLCIDPLIPSSLLTNGETSPHHS